MRLTYSSRIATWRCGVGMCDLRRWKISAFVTAMRPVSHQKLEKKIKKKLHQLPHQVPSTQHEEVHGLNLRQECTKLSRTREVPAGVASSTDLEVIFSIYRLSSQTENSMLDSRETSLRTTL